ncbi:MAG: acyl-phosphate glycerol 3-phosphate acyltransferase [Desulfobacca sp. 4484_104]|nr:MAG: acyl-phosphate glycerol 3-phosphate acyltransferase [Desulfobacca sp. 4484_104]RLA90223.1 MAG: acyl-phosphate glycerol 3-phosphate acyltransferase [Deltaproteobacteria bacterium]
MGDFLGLLLAAYLLGSIPTGLIVAWLMGGPDPRQEGSRNIGAANVYRLLGRNAGVFTLFGDVMKGVLPVFVARFGPVALGAWHGWAIAAVGLAAVLGHIYPLYLRFKGGKGVATGFGVIVTLCPLAALFLIAVWVALVSYYRLVSLASLAAAWMMPLAVGLCSGTPSILVLAGMISLLILFRHRDNIVRLAKGEEVPLDFSQKAQRREF